MRELLTLNHYFTKYRWRVFSGILFVILSNAFRVYNPRVVGQAVDYVTQSLATTGTPQALTGLLQTETGQALLVFFAVYLVVSLLEGAFMFLMRQTIIVVSRLIEFDMKSDIYDKYQQLDLGFYRRNNTGDLMNRITEDVSRVRMYVGPAIMYLVNLFFTIAFALVAMFRINAELTVYVLLPLPLLSFTIYYINGIIDRVSEKLQERLSDLTSYAQEIFSGIRVVQAYTREREMTGLFDEESNRYRNSALSMAKTEALWFPVMNFFIGISMVLAIGVGGVKVGSGKITSGNIAEFILYVNMLMWPVSSLGWVAGMIQRAAASQRRINEFMHQQPAIPVNEGLHTKIEGDIEFRNVSFTYPDTGIRALKNVSFKINRGERWAVIGKTGSGKTTIADLLLRMYDATEGEVLLDGKNIRGMHAGNLRNQIGYVPQDLFLFSDTVNENIAFGIPQADEEEVKKYAAFAAVDREIETFPDQYKTIVGERGVTLSGGQKQRISIARALIKKPSLLILDDSLSAVDAATEKQIQQSLDELLRNRTSIIITHRIFSLIHFDGILVMQDGEIAEQGTHEQLVALNGIYAATYRYQQTEEHIAG